MGGEQYIITQIVLMIVFVIFVVKLGKEADK